MLQVSISLYAAGPREANTHVWGGGIIVDVNNVESLTSPTHQGKTILALL